MIRGKTPPEISFKPLYGFDILTGVVVNILGSVFVDTKNKKTIMVVTG